MASARWEWVRSILFYTHLKKKGWLNPVGEMKVEKKEAEPDGATINSLGMVWLPWMKFYLFALIWLHGNQSEGEEDQAKHCNENYITFLHIPFTAWNSENHRQEPKQDMDIIAQDFVHLSQIKWQKLLVSRDGAISKAEVKAINSYISELAKQHEYKFELESEPLETTSEGKTKRELEPSKLDTALPEGDHPNPPETWSNKWVASPFAYLLLKKEREAWLGDLNEANSDMLKKGYPRWLVHVINIGRTAVLVRASLDIKLSDLISLGLKKIK